MKKYILCLAVIFLVCCGGRDQEVSTSSNDHGHSHESGEAHDHDGNEPSHDPGEANDHDGSGHSHEPGEALDHDGNDPSHDPGEALDLDGYGHSHDPGEAAHQHPDGGDVPAEETRPEDGRENSGTGDRQAVEKPMVEETSRDNPGDGSHEHAELRVSRQKQLEWGIVVETPKIQNISSRADLPGTMALNQNKTAHVSSITAGQILFFSTDLGDRVTKGQTLVTINSPAFGKAQADFMNTRAQLNLSRIEYERAQVLLEKHALNEREYLRRKAAFEKFTTEYGALGSKLHSYGMTHEQIEKLIHKCDPHKEREHICEIADPNLPIRSPVSGTVIFRDAVVGEHVEPGKKLFTVSDLSTLWAVLDAYEKDMPYIHKNSTVHIKSQLYPEKVFPGKITYISDLIDPQLRTIKIRVEVKNEAQLLKPNMYVQGVIKNEAGEKEILAVPDEAIQNLDGEKIVFIMEKENVFIPRRVSPGKLNGDLRIVKDGLEKNDRFVSRGAFTLKTELTKSTFGGAHVH